jgi:cyclohexanone monooxygenase
MYMLYQLRQRGYSVHVFETGSDVGGTWYWNRYPGARCDVESLSYSYSFDEELQQEWHWSERFAPQPEILSYAGHVADRFDLRRDISFNTKVASAHYQEQSNRWTLRTEEGQEYESEFLVTAVGCLSAARTPDWPGLDSFEGEFYSTAQWPHEPVDFTGKRVGLIGTGSSGVQSTPLIAAQAESLTVFQRTPNFSVPARNRALSPEEIAEVKDEYPAYRDRARHDRSGIFMTSTGKAIKEVSLEEAYAEYDRRWEEGGMGFLGAYTDTGVDPEANEILAGYIRGKIAEIVQDPDVAQRLMPHDHPVGSKRICVDTDYYNTFNRDNVTLVDVRHDPIRKILAHGVQTASSEFELDVLVLATGFDAMTGPLTRIDIRGVDGLALKETWAAGPQTYLGLATAGFPNLFMITGPGSPSVLSNMIVSIEQHVEWISDFLDYLRDNDLHTVSADRQAQDEWVAHVNELASYTLFPTANSWYMGANIPGKPRVFMPYVGGVGAYREKCDEIARDKYPGFVLA